MRRLIQLLAPLLFPFLLSWLPVAGIFLAAHQKQAFELRQQREGWEEQARNLVEEARVGCTYEDQMRRAGQELKRKLARITDPEFQLTGEFLVKAVKNTFPGSHLPPGTLLFGFAQERKGHLKVLQHPDLTRGSGKLISDVIAPSLDMGSVDSRAVVRLSKRLQGLFGDCLDFDAFTDVLRGRVFPGMFQGRRSLIFWDGLASRQKTVGAFLLVIPFSARETARPLQHCLASLPREVRGLTVAFLPQAGEEKVSGAIWPRVLPASLNIRRQLRRAVRFDRPKRDGLFPAGRRSEAWSGLWTYRDLLRADHPYEIWVVGEQPRGLVERAKMGIMVFALLIACAWTLTAARVLMADRPPAIPMKWWMLSFVLFLAMVAAASLYGLATHYIESAVVRKTDEQLKDLRDRLRRFDDSITLVLSRHQRHFQDLLSNVPLTRGLLFGGSREQTRLAETVFSTFSLKQARMELVDLLVYRFRPTVEYRGFSGSELTSPYTQVRLGMYGQLMEGSVKRFQGSEQLFRRTSQMNQGGLSNIMSGALDPTAYGHFLSMRQKAELVARENAFGITYHDFFADNGQIVGAIMLIARAEEPFGAVLREVLSKESSMQEGSQFVFGQTRFGSFETPYPREEKFWNARDGKKMRELLMGALESGTDRRRVLPGRAFMAVPSGRVGEFVLGGTVSLDHIQHWKSENETLLRVCLAVFLAFVLLLGTATANFLLIPLGEVERGLTAVGRGDLSIRLGQKRNDELGDLCQAFDQMIAGIEERRALGSFVSGQLDALVSRTRQPDDLTPDRRTAVILVSDIRGFTTMSEQHPAREVVKMLNTHHRAMGEEIQAGGGFVELFIGDAVVAFFPDDASGSGSQRAVAVARRMMARHRGIQEERRQAGVYLYEIGIGLDRGEVMAGPLGTADRQEYVVIGPARERAETMEGWSKEGHLSRIILSPELAGFCRETPLEKLTGKDAYELAEEIQPA